MATVSFISYKSQSKGSLKGVVSYVTRKDKTDDRKYLSGVNCTPQFAYREFTATREMYRKKSPVWFYHYIQSFSPEEHITPELAKKLAEEFAKNAWPESEILIATHVDREHIHTHFIVNSVCFESGKMLRQGPDTLFRLRKISDELCKKYGLSVLENTQKHSDGMNTREYRTAVKGESWKFQVINAVDICMRRSKTKKEFIENMEQLGYGVRWEDGRQNITYTHPCGRKVRDEKLHDKKYLKARMEYEFRIRREIISGRTEASQYAEADAADHYRENGTEGAYRSDYANTADDTAEAGYDRSFSQAQGIGREYEKTETEYGAAENDARTGWEEEREEAFAENYSAAYGRTNSGADYIHTSGIVSDLVLLGKRLEHSQSAPAIKPQPGHIDRKRRKKLQEKKIALGHKEDDHEEYEGPNMSM